MRTFHGLSSSRHSSASWITATPCGPHSFILADANVDGYVEITGRDLRERDAPPLMRPIASSRIAG
jgi:hypothetical protein